mmetsp:Transcript_23247/g.37894  ORF Transcript_23247/g.37894 Transcript_23247/m.37894 type:complete len:113 (+) Transcript_23247:126-464(+)
MHSIEHYRMCVVLRTSSNCADITTAHKKKEETSEPYRITEDFVDFTVRKAKSPGVIFFLLQSLNDELTTHMYDLAKPKSYSVAIFTKKQSSKTLAVTGWASAPQRLESPNDK